MSISNFKSQISNAALTDRSSPSRGLSLRLFGFRFSFSLRPFGFRPSFGPRPSGFGFRLALVLLLSPLPAARAQSIVPLVHAHAHNDYEHTHPLFDALDRGFCSVEADVHLVNGQLLVAHNRWQTQPGRTLQALYLDPLRAQVKKNGGHVYPNGPECTLLVDLKDNWRTDYPPLRKILESYADILTTFENGKKRTNAITVIITGDRSREMFVGETVRYAALDGALADLDSPAPAGLIPWISSNWSQSFQWRGTGPMPEAEKAKVQDIVAKAHQQGRQVRFWGAPDKLAFWQAMRTNGVDLVNTDDLEGAKRFLLTELQPRPAEPKVNPQAKAR